MADLPLCHLAGAAEHRRAGPDRHHHAGLRAFAQIDVMTSGGPLDSTQVLVFQAVERGYERQDISGGSTISVCCS
jgi:hypothetical protein